MPQKRYQGLRWKIIFGRYISIEKFAVEELQREIQSWLPYVVEVSSSADAAAVDSHEILVGTAASNPRIAALIQKNWITVPAAAEAYSIRVSDHPEAAGKRLIVIAGHDEAGALYGVEEFNAQLNLQFFPEPATTENRRTDFDRIPDMTLSDQPAIRNRGIWTWGYVIYDYRRFIDNMARLKMNMLTIWNDCVPLNCRDIIAYAHDRGVKIILGFHWGWGVPGLELGHAADRQKIKDIVLNEYRAHYRGLGIDGIYFQTLTETPEMRTGDMTIAAAACTLVNDISLALLKDDPNLLIQFGLHATSIRENFNEFKNLDSRVVIVWEDAGDVPYGYTPGQLGFHGTPWTKAWKESLDAGKDLFDCTLEYSKQLATFRPNTEFALVPKGWICLRWGAEFENHGPFLLGERQPEFVRERRAERQPRWDYIDRLWPKFYGRAAQFYRAMIDCQPSAITVTGLVEDGVFEAGIPISVAVFAQTLWNPIRPDEELVCQAGSRYYQKAQL